MLQIVWLESIEVKPEIERFAAVYEAYVHLVIWHTKSKNCTLNLKNRHYSRSNSLASHFHFNFVIGS